MIRNVILGMKNQMICSNIHWKDNNKYEMDNNKHKMNRLIKHK